MESSLSMAKTSLTTPLSTALSGKKALKYSAVFWLTTVMIGQIIFCFYIILFYYKPTLTGNFAQWNKVMPHGFIQGDTIRNSCMARNRLYSTPISATGLCNNSVVGFLGTSSPDWQCHRS